MQENCSISGGKGLRRSLVKLSLSVLLLFIVLGLLTDVGYWLIGKWMGNFPKVFFYSMILIMMSIFFLTLSIPKSFFIKYWFAYSCFLIVYGLYSNPINKSTLAHLFPIVLPILGLFYGSYVSKYFPDLIVLFQKRLILSGMLLSFFTLVYFFLVQSGAIPYYGAGVLFAFPVFYAALKKQYFLCFLFIIAAFLTGKRSVLFAIILVFLVMHLYNNRKALLFFVCILLASFFVFLNFNFLTNFSESGVFSRYVNVLDVLLSINLNDFDLVAIDMVTSGRIYDAIAAYDAIKDSLFTIMFGRGIGARFEVLYSFADSVHITHYSHFTPVSYMFLGGLFMTIPVYMKLFSVLIFSLNRENLSLFTMVYIYYFFMGLIGGAVFFTDPFVWFVVGIISYEITKKRKNKAEFIAR